MELPIFYDSREQRPWSFEEQDATLTEVTLNTGDYTLPHFCEYSQSDGIYYPTFAVERKGGDDFVSSITQERERFRREIKRASDWDVPLQVVIEEPKLKFKRNRGFFRYRDVSAKMVFGTVDNWEQYFNVEFHFSRDRQSAQERSYTILRQNLAASLVAD